MMIIMMIFNNIYFSQNFISLFGGLFNDETDLRRGKVLTFVENRLNSMNEIYISFVVSASGEHHP